MAPTSSLGIQGMMALPNTAITTQTRLEMIGIQRLEAPKLLVQR